MFSRSLYTYDDHKITWKQLLFLILIQLGGLLLYRINPVWFALLASTILIQGLAVAWDVRREHRLSGRVSSFLIFMLTSSIFASPALQITFNKKWLLTIFTFLEKHTSFFHSQSDWYALLVLSTGMLFLFTEVNTLIRYIFNRLGLSIREPQGNHAHPEKEEVENRDKYENKAGRIIGPLERYIIYFAVLSNQPAIVGFVFAAKAFARVKELQDRNNAEYVLIGTLLSILSAIFVALISKYLTNDILEKTLKFTFRSFPLHFLHL
jgi:hypothetical protein